MPRPRPRPIPEHVARAGELDPRERPMITARRPSTRPGWDDCTVSLYPGRDVTVAIRAGLSDPDALAAVLAATQATYSPAGLRTDPYKEGL